MDTALTQKFPIILDRNLVNAQKITFGFCTSCDKVVLGLANNKLIFFQRYPHMKSEKRMRLNVYLHTDTALHSFQNKCHGSHRFEMTGIRSIYLVIEAAIYLMNN